MKSIIERETTFENNSDMEVKVTQKQLSRAFVEGWLMFMCSYAELTNAHTNESITKDSFSLISFVGIQAFVKVS